MTATHYVSDGCHEPNRTCHDRAVLGNVNHPAGISGGLAIKSSHPSRPSRAVHQHPEPHRNSARHIPLCPGTPPQVGVGPHRRSQKWGYVLPEPRPVVLPSNLRASALIHKSSTINHITDAMGGSGWRAALWHGGCLISRAQAGGSGRAERTAAAS
jgi:hypothetical protein